MQREKTAWEMTRRYGIFACSVLIISLGVSLAVKAALGVSPIAALPYTVSLIFTDLSVGTWNAIWNFLLIAAQPIVRPNKIDWNDLFIQCIMTCFFGYFIDFFLMMLGWYTPETYLMQIFTILCGCGCLAVGAYLGIIAKVSMLPMDSLLLVLSDVTKKHYATLRVTGDVGLTAISAVLCLVVLGELIGVREGTIIAALIVGNLIKLLVNNLKAFTYFLLPEAVLEDSENVTMPTQGEEEEHFVITLSHEYGSGGRTIARRIAHELGMAYYDAEIIELAAKKTGYTERFVQENEERIDNNALFRLIDWYTDSYRLQGESLEKQLFHVEADVIRDIAAKHSCVIVGRLANYVLRNHANSLHIFITADDMERVQRVMRKENLTEQEAATKILAFADERKNHCHEFSELEWGNSLSYDITMKSSKYGVDRTAAILIELIKQFVDR